MTAEIIDGKAFAAALRARIAGQVEIFAEAAGRPPGLAVVLVGEDPASAVYVRSKHKAVREAGMLGFEHRFPADVPEAELLALVDQLNADVNVDGILVQLPLPPHINEMLVTTRIDPDKDVDGFHPVNVGRLATGGPALVSCTPLGCLILLKRVLGDLTGKRAVVVGRSNIVGKPMAQLLLRESATVVIAHSKTRDLPALTREADILVAAIGRPEMIRGDWIKPGAAVIDVGMNRVPSRRPKAAAAGKTIVVGDVAFEEANAVAGWLTPVPGGVGPMTIACLLLNTLTATRRSLGLADQG